ncbi:hypothetical protein GW17_00061837 [Ensete ventricosum]|nr:hypothetical protein GW17_00061837 [Ensete ventricosum]
MSEAMAREATTHMVGESSKTTWGASRREGFIAGSAHANGCASSSRVDSSTKATRMCSVHGEAVVWFNIRSVEKAAKSLIWGALGKAGGDQTMPCRVLALAERVVREVLNAGGSAASIVARRYKESRGSLLELQRSGQTTYEYGYRVVLARFRA